MILIKLQKMDLEHLARSLKEWTHAIPSEARMCRSDRELFFRTFQESPAAHPPRSSFSKCRTRNSNQNFAREVGDDETSTGWFPLERDCNLLCCRVGERTTALDWRTFVRAAVGAVAMNASDDDRLRGGLTLKSDATSEPIMPLVPVDQAARLGEKLGIDRPYATSNVFRGLLNSPPATAGFYGLVNALFFHNKVAPRTRELMILRIGWCTGSEYVFCNHVRFSHELGIPGEEILGVRDPQGCHAYTNTDRAVLHLADELHERAEVTPSTWAVLEKAFAPDELVELLLIGGFWRMAAGFVKSAKIPLDAGVPSWPEGRKPDNSTPE